MYEFSWLWFMVGLGVVIAGILCLRFYKQIADNIGSGVVSYERYKLVALGLCGAGILMMFSLHILVLRFIGETFFSGVMR